MHKIAKEAQIKKEAAEKEAERKEKKDNLEKLNELIQRIYRKKMLKLKRTIEFQAKENLCSKHIFLERDLWFDWDNGRKEFNNLNLPESIDVGKILADHFCEKFKNEGLEASVSKTSILKPTDTGEYYKVWSLTVRW
ncbi:MAG: hypothetical protein WC678_04460 [Parcubacteria group bacterium]